MGPSSAAQNSFALFSDQPPADGQMVKAFPETTRCFMHLEAAQETLGFLFKGLLDEVV